MVILIVETDFDGEYGEYDIGYYSTLCIGLDFATLVWI